ncbi:DUF1353 domain-containing protein [Chelatococcus sambhunathii]|uniref:DUF1353 domain-containing protein n=1 Tax=Chelatococcus sambhunathii TaxID=363953 RepID=A0ABU1DEU5_9HYPH|nr:DUF1353 domain-containing protein [Chelatococcus sambhunathii]MDR4306644.1 DUF1353 domain-containing protein [Chelatococcus sambhunathii]
MRILMCILVLIGAFCASSANAEFKGHLSLGPNPKDETGATKVLLSDFGYIDPNGLGWEASKGDITDGASIPKIFHPLIGDNWTFEYLKAAIIHDHYCVREARSWRQTNRVFFDILIESGVDRIRSAAMYYAVLVGSHKWKQPAPGINCKITKNCIKTVGGETLISRPPVYDDPKIAADVQNFHASIEANPSALSAEEIEALAAQRNPGDVFLNGGSGAGGLPTK